MSTPWLRAATAAEIPAGGGEPPREVLLLPAGQIVTRAHDSRPPWRNDDPAAVVAATAELGLDLPIDYEHQTQLSEQNGQPAPAAGWIRRVFERAGAIWAEVDWLDKAAAMIRAREYRFISAAFDYEKNTRRIVRIRGAGLTNDPALFQQALARTQPESEDEMNLEKLRKALGLSDTATEAEIVAAATAAVAAQAALGAVVTALGLAENTAADAVAAAAKALADNRKAVAKAAGLAEDASTEDVEKAVAAAKAGGTNDGGGNPDPSKFVPRSEFDRVSERLTALEESGTEASATAAVDQAIKDGKVAPANREWALGYAKKDADGFAEFVKGAPKILPDGRVAPTSDPDGKTDTLSADEKAVCRATGISEEDFVKSKKALAEAGEQEG